MKSPFWPLFPLLLATSVSHAQRDLVTPGGTKRLALVIGNAAYRHTSVLSNTLNDMDAVAAALCSTGFEVISVKDATLRDLDNRLDEFTVRIESGNYTVALCFFSGHGLQVNGENYLVPIDANPQRESDVRYTCLNAQRILDRMEEARALTKIVLLDACRNNPLPKSWGRTTSSGLAYMQAPKGTFIGYATAPGTIASDGVGKNSPYTAGIIKHLQTPGLDIHQVFTRVAATTQELAAKEGKTQTPFINSNLTGDFYFAAANTTPSPNLGTKPSSNADTYTDPLAGTFVRIRGGAFDMGSNEGDSKEKPVHRVTLSEYYIGQTEVTQAQWRTVMGNNPSYFKDCDDCPVEDVTWDDVQLFLQKLNARSGGARYRLPTEAEWEYAARGGVQSRGTRYAGSNNVDEVAWRSSYDGGTHPVKGKRANELGLYDMSGNVWEWCADWYGSDYYAASTSFNPTGPSTSGYFRVLRGGSWCDALHEQNNNGSQPDFSAYCSVTFRNFEGPDYRTYCVGFRLARTF